MKLCLAFFRNTSACIQKAVMTSTSNMRWTWTERQNVRPIIVRLPIEWAWSASQLADLTPPRFGRSTRITCGGGFIGHLAARAGTQCAADERTFACYGNIWNNIWTWARYILPFLYVCYKHPCIAVMMRLQTVLEFILQKFKFCLKGW